MSAADPKHFRSSVAVDALGWMQICEMRTGAQRVRRTRLLAERAEASGYKVTLQLDGRSEIRQAARTALLMPGEWGIYDTTRPYEVDVDDNAHFLVMQVPAKQSEAWLPAMRNAVARSFSAPWLRPDGHGSAAGGPERTRAPVRKRRARRRQRGDADDGARHQ
ncbi:hypothetical protein WJ971_26390 [Achromobacter xylosoxidans]